ncbi:MAG: DUF5615 family PIN-like protein [Chitinophagaceae bacterium]|nr:DUF5615 family PIN-like protein [Chitinophagaceae bacterium]
MKFIIDENLPMNVQLWKGGEFVHVINIESLNSDSSIWSYARENDLVIISKDSDFHQRILFTNPPPKVILFRTGNMKFSEFELFISKHWEEILLKILNSKLVIVYKERIEFII